VKVGDTDSPFFAPPKDSTVILHENLQFAPQTARVFLQRGQTHQYGFNRYYPWCYIQVNAVVDAPQTLRADTFEVYRVVSREEQVVEHEPIRLAGVAIERGGDLQTGQDLRLAVGNGGGGPSTVTQTVQLWLRSEKQSNIRKMVCGGAEDNPATALPPSILEIQGALGAIATLKIPQPKDA
jgi:hypothetical protein